MTFGVYSEIEVTTMPSEREHDPLVVGLVELCRCHGKEVSISRITNGIELSDEGRFLLHSAPKALRRANMAGKVVRIALNAISDHALPALLVLDGDSTLILENLDAEEATVILPESGGGRSKIARKKLEVMYQGHAVIAKPLDVVSNRVGNLLNAKEHHWILKPLLDNWPIYKDVLVASLTANLLALATVIFVMQVYDRVVPNQAVDTLWVLASGVGLAIIMEFVLRVMRARLIDISGRDLDLRLSKQLFHRVVNLRLSHQPKSVGVFANQIRDFSSVREFFTANTVAAICDLPFVLIFIGVLWFIGGPIAIVVVLGTVAILLPGAALQKYLARMSRQNTRESSALNGLLLEAVSSLESVKAARAELRLEKAYGQLNAAMAGSATRTRQVTALLTQGASSMQQITYVALIVTGVYLINAGNLTVGGLIACSILSGRTLSPVGQISGLLARWQYVKSSMENLDEIMKMPIERDDDRHYIRADVLRGEYELEGVGFSHDREQGDTLSIASLKIDAGEHVALLGSNGAGKSTLLRLLAGLLESKSGSVRIDNLSINQIDPIDRRRQIGYLPQSVALFQGTLRDNLCLDHGLHSDDEMFAALDAVGLGPFVRKHVRGLDLVIHSSGNVSGGQKQAIGLARVILQDPSVVILDEPTSAFDSINEQHVIRFMSEWLKGRTAIISTHKKDILSLASRAVVLKHGSIAHDGSVGEMLSLANKSTVSQDTNLKAVK